MGYAYNMAEERRRCPADDIVTKLVQADIDGEAMVDVEFSFFVILLAVAGNETTRKRHDARDETRSSTNPDQWELYKRNRPETTADEIVRWATPVHCFQRTALADTELGGVTIREGQRVGLFYSSANYGRRGVSTGRSNSISCATRTRISALAATAPHYCIGANLARMEIKLIFNEDRQPDFRTSPNWPNRNGFGRGGSTGSRSYRSPTADSIKACAHTGGRARPPRPTRKPSPASSTPRARPSTNAVPTSRSPTSPARSGSPGRPSYRYFPSTDALLVAAAVARPQRVSGPAGDTSARESPPAPDAVAKPSRPPLSGCRRTASGCS